MGKPEISARSVSAMLRERLVFIIPVTLPLKIVVQNETLLSSNIMILLLQKATSLKIVFQHIFEHNKYIIYGGVNVHNQNGVSEWLIHTVSEISHAMMLHSSICWENDIDSNLRPMSTSYATYIYNHMPNVEDIIPADIFTVTKCTCHNVRDLHVCGVFLYMYYIPCFNNVINYQNGRHILLAGYLLGSV